MQLGSNNLVVRIDWQQNLLSVNSDSTCSSIAFKTMIILVANFGKICLGNLHVYAGNKKQSRKARTTLSNRANSVCIFACCSLIQIRLCCYYQGWSIMVSLTNTVEVSKEKSVQLSANLSKSQKTTELSHSTYHIHVLFLCTSYNIYNIIYNTVISHL